MRNPFRRKVNIEVTVVENRSGKARTKKVTALAYNHRTGIYSIAIDPYRSVRVKVS